MQQAASRHFLSSETAILIYLSLVTLLVHFLTNGGYGYFRDEFYYMACGEHLDWGYVDQPPFVALMAYVTRHLLGDSLFALRFFPAVCGALQVLLAGLIAREVGGGRFAQCLTATATIVAPVYLGINNFYSMNCFDLMFWSLAAYIVVRIVKYDNPRLWLIFSLVAGVGLMNKYSMGFLGFGLVVGLALTPARKHLASKWLWLGGGVAFLIFLPHILWEYRHGFPTLEFIRNAAFKKNLPLSPLMFMFQSVLNVNPLTLPLSLAGLYFYLVSREGKPYGVLGWIYLAVVGVFLVTRAKPYYLSPAYTMLFAGGAVALEHFTREHGWNLLKPAYAGLLVLSGLVIGPFVLPILPVETFLKYQDFLGFKPPKEERGKPDRLPQQYADMFGWENMVATVAKVYNSLSPEEKARTLIFCHNYGEAGAVDFFGKKYGLPKASSGHNNYWYWGPQNPSADIVITVGERLDDVQKSFNKVEMSAVVVSEYARFFETNLPIYIGREPKMPLKDIWPRTRDFI